MCRVATPFQFLRTGHYGDILTGTPPPPITGASNAGGVG